MIKIFMARYISIWAGTSKKIPTKISTIYEDYYYRLPEAEWVMRRALL